MKSDGTADNAPGTCSFSPPTTLLPGDRFLPTLLTPKGLGMGVGKVKVQQTSPWPLRAGQCGSHPLLSWHTRAQSAGDQAGPSVSPTFDPGPQLFLAGKLPLPCGKEMPGLTPPPLARAVQWLVGRREPGSQWATRVVGTNAATSWGSPEISRDG